MPYGLGRGLSSLIPPKRVIKSLPESEKPEIPPGAKLMDLPLGIIRPNPKQPREDFGYQELEDLIASIREHGILQPLVVSKIDAGNYELIAGERRLKAAKVLNLKTVPAVVRDAKEEEKLELALIENIQRKNLNPVEEAQAFRRLMDEFGLTQEEVARKVGKSRPVIANTLRLLNLPEEIQRALRSNKISESHARILLSFVNPKAQLKYFKKVLKEDLTVRQTENVVRLTKKSKGFAANPNLTAKEEAMRNALGTKVEIKKTGRGGQVIIHFYSDEELNGIVRKIAKK